MIATIAPEARILDITHGIEPQAVLQGALVLRNAVRYAPVGVHLAVVDPDVGGSRRAVALRTVDGRFFVGPDNGLLMLAAERLGARRGARADRPRFRLADVSRTFHARDIFAPAAAHLAAGVPIEELGPAVELSTLVRISLPRPEIGRTQVHATAMIVDRFGNIATNVRRDAVDALGCEDGERVEVRLQLDRFFALLAGTFADAPPGELILYEDAYGLMSLAISQGDAARLTGVRPGDELRLART